MRCIFPRHATERAPRSKLQSARKKKKNEYCWRATTERNIWTGQNKWFTARNPINIWSAAIPKKREDRGTFVLTRTGSRRVDVRAPVRLGNEKRGGREEDERYQTARRDFDKQSGRRYLSRPRARSCRTSGGPSLVNHTAGPARNRARLYELMIPN